MVMFLSLLTVGYVFFRLSMDNLILLGVFEVLAGLTVSPTFATGNLIVKDLVPAESLTEGLSWVTTAGTVGTSIGSSVAGIVLDASNLMWHDAAIHLHAGVRAIGVGRMGLGQAAWVKRDRATPDGWLALRRGLSLIRGSSTSRFGSSEGA